MQSTHMYFLSTTTTVKSNYDKKVSKIEMKIKPDKPICIPIKTRIEFEQRMVSTLKH